MSAEVPIFGEKRDGFLKLFLLWNSNGKIESTRNFLKSDRFGATRSEIQLFCQ